MKPVVIVSCLAIAQLLAGSASGQDRLFIDSSHLGTGVVEVGAIGQFGQPLSRIGGRIPPPPRDASFVGRGRDLVEVATGAVVWTAPVGESIEGAPLITPDHSRVFVDTRVDGVTYLAAWTYAVDVASGSTVARSGALPNARWDPVGRRLITNAFDAQLTVYDANLVSIGSFKPASSHCAPSLSISPHTGRAYVIYVGEGSGGRYGPSDTRLMAIDLAQSRVVDDVSLVQTIGVSNRAECPPEVILWTAPAAPQGVRAAVSGREVALSWFAADFADRYVLDIGVAPGRTDASYFVGPSTQIRFATVPPGIYFVRVRAGNAAGGGHPSAEIRVVVP
jgi:hypothetical protein